MLPACVRRFDVMGIVGKFLTTKHALKRIGGTTKGLIGWLPKLWHAKIWALPILKPSLGLVPKDAHISHLFYQNGGKVFCFDFGLPKMWHANFFWQQINQALNVTDLHSYILLSACSSSSHPNIFYTPRPYATWRGGKLICRIKHLSQLTLMPIHSIITIVKS